MYFEANSLLGYRIRPNSEGFYRDGITAIGNKFGHRDDEVNLEKEANVCRIVVLGDSFTVGAGVRQEDAYPQILERLLNEDFEYSVEVINTGVGGWAPFHYAQYYEYYGRKFNPDLVVIGFFVGNDTYTQVSRVEESGTAILGQIVKKKYISDWIIYPVVLSYNNLHIARLILNMFSGLRPYLRERDIDNAERFIEFQSRKLEHHLTRKNFKHELFQNNLMQLNRIKHIADTDNIPVIIALIPDVTQINTDLQVKIIDQDEIGKYDFDMPQTILGEIFLESDFIVVDFFHILMMTNVRYI